MGAFEKGFHEEIEKQASMNVSYKEGKPNRGSRIAGLGGAVLGHSLAGVPLRIAARTMLKNRPDLALRMLTNPATILSSSALSLVGAYAGAKGSQELSKRLREKEAERILTSANQGL